jgi:hypothetical protein
VAGGREVRIGTNGGDWLAGVATARWAFRRGGRSLRGGIAGQTLGRYLDGVWGLGRAGWAGLVGFGGGPRACKARKGGEGKRERRKRKKNEEAADVPELVRQR